MSHCLRIMGIDPGLRHMGWGVVALDGTRLSFVACGSINPPAGEALAARLAHLHRALSELVADHAPDEVAVEETFVNKDARATLKLGQARGIALVVPALAGLSVAEYAPNAVKKAVVGVGHAEKAQIGLMVKTLLPKATIPSADAADALALAICHAHHRPASLAAALRRASA